MPTKLPNRAKKPQRPRRLRESDKRYAEWLATTVEMPTPSERLEKYREFRQRKVALSTMQGIERSDAFRYYFDDIVVDERRRAAKMFDANSPKGVAAHFQGLEMAMENSDYRAVPSFTVPVLDRVIPKKPDQVQAMQVVVNVTPEQIERLRDSETPEIEVEVLGERVMEHVEDGSRCWCQPEVLRVCPECDDAEESPTSCWRCGGRGLIEAQETWDADVPLVIVHRDDRDES
jgi:hypothetical protein